MTSTQFTTGHIGLNVSDLSRSKDFYKRVFGFEVLGESNDKQRAFAFLGRDQNVVLTLWQQSDGAFTTNRPGLHHLSFQVDSISQVQEVERLLRDIGVVIHHDGIVPHREGADSGGVFFEDPDGIRLEIFAATGAAAHHAPYEQAPTCGFF
jgi:catechol 2,3-dioxygenase-like lactoylglutathione lyase family enzyme